MNTKIDNELELINISKKNVKSTNAQDINYLNMNVKKAEVIEGLMKDGYKVMVNIEQYETKEDKKLNFSCNQISKEVIGMKKLGLKSRKNEVYRYKLDFKETDFDELETILTDFEVDIFEDGVLCGTIEVEMEATILSVINN